MEFRFDGPEAARVFAFAHGAGAGMDSGWMERVARGLAREGIRVARFEFPYMAARREGSRRGPDRPQVLMDTWREVIETLGPAGRLVIGGKSMGGRIASMVADEAGVAGIVCFGYPFHPAGKPQQLRVAHLEALRTPALVLQGERDSMGRRDEVEEYRLSDAIDVRWLPDGDHSLKPRKASGVTEAENLATAIEAAAAFIRGRTGGSGDRLP